MGKREMKHCFCAVICKTCKREGVKTWIALKYIGPDDGHTVYTLPLPPAPLLVLFNIQCEACGETNSYTRDDLEAVSLDQPPPAHFVEQF